MKIHSKFRDYYDLQSEVDRSYVWARKTEDLDPNDFKSFHFPSTIIKVGRRYSGYEITCAYVFFCGKIYIGVNEYNPDTIQIDKNIKNKWVWGQEAAKVIEKYGGGRTFFELFINKGKSSKFADFDGKDCHDINLKYNSPIVVYKQGNRRGKLAESCPNLSELGFASAVDCYSARQDIERFLRNDLAFQNKPLDIPDKYRIVQAGFDLKTSFRKDTPPTRKQG